MNRTLIIDALPFEKGKAYGYQEYLFNLLDYFYNNDVDINFEKILIVCNSLQIEHFDKYKDKFKIHGFKYNGLMKRILIQNTMYLKIGIGINDVILFTGNYSSLIKKCKHVLVIHDLLYLRKNLLPKPLMRWQRSLFVPRSVKLADNVIAISEFTRQDLLKNISSARIKPEKIIKIYNYFNFSKFSTLEESELEIKKGKYFLCVSSSEYHKNLITVLRSFEVFSFQNGEVDLYIVGNLKNDAKNYYDQLDNSVKARIKILSNINNTRLAGLYKNCAAYISATFFEGLGMPIVEAMYFNCKVIVSNLDVLREITLGKAVYFEPDSVEQLSDRLLNYQKLQSFNFKEQILDIYSEDKTSGKYINILNNI